MKKEKSDIMTMDQLPRIWNVERGQPEQKDTKHTRSEIVAISNEHELVYLAIQTSGEIPNS
jgi:hypothetical protein